MGFPDRGRIKSPAGSGSCLISFTVPILSAPELAETSSSRPPPLRLICQLALETLLRAEQIQQAGAVLARSGWRARLPETDEKLAGEVGAAYQAAGWATPTPAELAQRLARPPAQIDKMVRLLVDRAVLLRLGEQQFIHREAVESARNLSFAFSPKERHSRQWTFATRWE